MSNRKDLILREEQPPATIIDVIRAAVVSPDIDVTKLREIVILQERLEERAAKKEFDAAMARLMPKLPHVSKDGCKFITPKSGGKPFEVRYAKFEDIHAALSQFLEEEGFATSFESPGDWNPATRMVKVTMLISHRLGHRETKEINLPLDEGGAKSLTDAMQSTISRGKRYLLLNGFNIVTVDEEQQADLNQPIASQQIDVIEDLINRTNTNLERFLKWVGAASVADIRQVDYKRTVSELNRKLGGTKTT